MTISCCISHSKLLFKISFSIALFIIFLDHDQFYQFTKEELLLFERRYENGYDFHNDEGYNAWLNIHLAHDSDKVSVTCGKQ